MGVKRMAKRLGPAYRASGIRGDEYLMIYMPHKSEARKLTIKSHMTVWSYIDTLGSSEGNNPPTTLSRVPFVVTLGRVVGFTRSTLK